MKIFLPLLLLSLLAACSKSASPQPVEMFTNTSVEEGASSPTSWWYYVSGSSATLIWSNLAASSGSHSLEISCANPTTIAYWGQSVAKNIPYGKTLTLKLKVKGNLTGNGAAVAIACLNATSTTQAQQFVSTEGNQSITGNFDWKTYTIQLAGVHSDITGISVYLMMLPGATGQVYFDEIELTAL